MSENPSVENPVPEEGHHAPDCEGQSAFTSSSKAARNLPVPQGVAADSTPSAPDSPDSPSAASRLDRRRQIRQYRNGVPIDDAETAAKVKAGKRGRGRHSAPPGPKSRPRGLLVDSLRLYGFPADWMLPSLAERAEQLVGLTSLVPVARVPLSAVVNAPS